MLVVAITALVLGVPLAISTWQLVEDFTRADLITRLEQVSRNLAGEEHPDEARLAAVELAVPAGGQLRLEQPGSPTVRIGGDPGSDAVSETEIFGNGGTM